MGFCQRWRNGAVGALIAASLSFLTPVTALASYGHGYTLDPNPAIGRDPAPVAYVFDHDITLLSQLKKTWAPSMRNPSDLFLDSQGDLWIADTDNNRILELNPQDHLIRIIGQTEKNQPKTQASLNGPEGVFVTPSGLIYVADSGNSRVAVFNKDGQFLRAFGRPATQLLRSDASYKPTKVLVDRRGYIYVINGGGDYRGIIEMDPNGIFRGFFGANRVQFSLTALFTRLFATAQQKAQIAKTLPNSDTNFFLSSDGFIYTVSATAQVGQVKKLNSLGKNVYRVTNVSSFFGLQHTSSAAFFGEKPRYPGDQMPQFVSIAVDNVGIISALDAASGKIYQYDQEGNLLDIFGGKSNSQDGYFDYPAALAVRANGDIYVLDSSRKDIQVFRPTQFATLIHEATFLYYDGKYSESARIWREVLRLDAHYALAHQQLGECYLHLGELGGPPSDFVTAMYEERLAENRNAYSAAFAQYRQVWANEHFTLLLGIIAGIVVVSVLVLKSLGRLVEAVMNLG
ncbi:MAG: NHL repeat-containing protein [Chloroflexi bacterium]|nr:NHL repeat-containing protein [Chloroflexota bacterium]